MEKMRVGDSFYKELEGDLSESGTRFLKSGVFKKSE
jgi:hypothetical protein